MALLLCLLQTACGDALHSLGALGAPATRAHARDFFGALAARVTLPERDLKYDSARVRIASAAVLPSRVWRDTSVWTSMSPDRRQLLVRGRFIDGRYLMEAASAVPYPSAPAESQHVIELRRLSENEYAWDTDVPYAVGQVSAAHIGAMFGAMFASAEGRSEAQVRTGYRTALPRTSSVAGELFRIDSIRAVPLADRSTTALYTISVTPQGLEGRYPQLATYLRRYVHTARMRLALVDTSGATYLEFALSNGQFTLRVRTAGGRMLALYGPARLMPDSLTLTADATVKVRGFTVGVRNYRGEFRVVRSDSERAWELISRQEPDWVLPLITEHLLRTPLRRPFQGPGAYFRIGIRDTANAQSILYRTLHLEVQESAILRFIGRLGAIAVSEYAGEVEREEMAWLRQLLEALLTDLRSI